MGIFIVALIIGIETVIIQVTITITITIKDRITLIIHITHIFISIIHTIMSQWCR